MRTTSFIFVLALLSIFGVSCHNETLSVQIPKFPSEYLEYMESHDSTTRFPVIGKDDGFCPISSNIEYYVLPDSLKGNAFADSLKTLYNTALAFNSIAYDISGYERQGEYYGYRSELLEAFKKMPLNGIGNPQIEKAFRKMLDGACEQIEQSEPVNGSEKGSAKGVYNSINPFTDKLLAKYEATRVNPESFLTDYNQVHELAICDTITGRDKILSLYLNEKNLNKKCAYAHEFALANHRHSEQNDTLLIAIIDPLLRGNEYSPLLRDLWIIWRTTMQIDLLGGSSNDSGMYNLFYNSMRNRVADKYIRHLAEHSDDSTAFTEFLDLAYEYNIVRNGPMPIGNNALMDLLSIYEPETGDEEE